MGSVRMWLMLAALNGLMAVAAGAFGAHGASDPQVKELLRTGAQYQLVHAAAGIACYGLLRVMLSQATLAAWLFGFGGLIFGVSLYLLAVTGVKILGAITPMGGVLMIVGWAVLLWGAAAGAATE